MPAEYPVSSQRRSYADQYLGRGAKPSDPESEPYGHWYAERLRQAGEAAADQNGGQTTRPYREDPADFSSHREPGRHPSAREALDPALDPGEREPAEPDPADLSAEADDHPQDAPDDAPDGAQAAAQEAEPQGTAPQSTGPQATAEAFALYDQPPVAAAPPASLSPATLRQLDQNADQLSLVEGNLVAAAQSEVSSVYVTSCFRGEGKTTAALSTAYGLAAISQARVLLVDASNNQARLHKMLAIDPYPGLNEVMEGRVALSHALHPVGGLPGMHVLAAGAFDHALLSEAKRVERIKAFLGALKPHYDFVVFDGASALASSDPARLASCFDGVVFVVACERTKWEVVQGAVEKVRSGGGRVLGGVLNRRRFYIPRIVYQWITR